MVLIILAILWVTTFMEAWTLMMTAGWAHLHLLEAIQPISYGVSLQAILITLPVQVVAVLFGTLGGD